MPNTTVIKMDPSPVSDSAVRPEIQEIFTEVFQHEDGICLQTSQEELEKWDSLRHVALVAALESRFSISLSMDEMMEMTDVSAIHRVLDRHGV